MAHKIFSGIVVTRSINNTVRVLIERRIQHPLYKKFVKKTKKILADSTNFDLAIGDKVRIEETRPLSKRKSFKVIDKNKE